MSTDTTVTLNEAESRYEIHLGDVLAGFAAFERRPGKILFVHTEIDPAFQGKGLASVLAAGALSDAAASDDTIVPYCPYIRKYLETHEVDGATVEFPRIPGT